MVALLLENGARIGALSSPPNAAEVNGAGAGANAGGETALELVQRALKGEVRRGTCMQACMHRW